MNKKIFCHSETPSTGDLDPTEKTLQVSERVALRFPSFLISPEWEKKCDGWLQAIVSLAFGVRFKVHNCVILMHSNTFGNRRRADSVLIGIYWLV